VVACVTIIADMELRSRALELLLCAEPSAKVAGTRALTGLVEADPELDVQRRFAPAPEALPGRPGRPRLVEPSRVPQRGVHTAAGRAALLHAVAHIEFNAINLALDAVWRFAGAPRAFYLDWVRVAAEEALHFSLVAEHLQALGHAYGDFDAHDGLWTMAERTRDDLAARMALVPRTMEARGLDVTPAMRARFAAAGDARAAEILDLILRDEIGHVAVGNHWYRWACAQAGLEPAAHAEHVADTHRAPRPRAPFNLEARRAAGFTEAELAALQRAAAAARGRV